MSLGKRILLSIVTVSLVLMIIIAVGSYYNRYTAYASPSDDSGDTYKALETFSQALSLVKNSYVEDVQEREIIYGAIKGMLQELDPHSTFFTPESYKSFKIGTSGSFGGLGITIALKDEMITIIAPIEDTPADKAGIKAGDIIVKIEDESTAGLSLEDATGRMRGKPGTKIRITIVRTGESKPIEMTLTRAIIKIKSVKYDKIDDIGYIRLSQFQESSTEEMVVALKALEKENVKGFIVDLRNNTGGLLTEAITISSLFLERDKTVVFTRDRTKEDVHYKTKVTSFNDIKRPMVVIVNEGSASASEIFAGALQDYNRALIVGTNTFGKASVQSIIEMRDGSAIKLTTSRYYTPLGRSIQGVGIVPDIVVKSGKITIDSNQSYLKEADLTNHLVGENEKMKNGGAETTSKATTKPDEKKAIGDNSSKVLPSEQDFQFSSGLQLLKGMIKYGSKTDK